MTIYDVEFILVMFGTAVVLLIAGLLALFGRKRAAQLVLCGLGGYFITSIGVGVALAVVAKQPPLGVGNPQCVDNWCIAVEDVKSTLRDKAILYDVTLCIFSRANRAKTSL